MYVFINRMCIYYSNMHANNSNTIYIYICIMHMHIYIYIYMYIHILYICIQPALGRLSPGAPPRRQGTAPPGLVVNKYTPPNREIHSM